MNVCVEPEEEILNSVPDEPTAKNCVVAESPLITETPAPEPELTTHFKPDGVDESAIKI